MFWVVTAVVLGTLWTSVLLWSAAVRRWQSGQPLLPVSHSILAPWGLIDLAIAGVCWLLMNLGGQLAAHSFLQVPPATELDQLDPTAQKTFLLLFGVASLASCILIAFLFRLRHRVTAEELGWNQRHMTGDLILGLQAFVMLAPIVYATQWFLTQFVDSEHPLIKLVEQNPDPMFFVVATFAAVIVAPISEEFLFRVLLQGWLERALAGPREPSDGIVFGGRRPPRLPQPVSLSVPNVNSTDPSEPVPHAAADTSDSGSSSPAIELGAIEHGAIEHGAPSSSPPSSSDPTVPELREIHPDRFALPEGKKPSWPPIVISSLIFALFHWSHGPDPIPLFFFALGLGYLFQRTHRILPCVVLHFLLNLCSMLAFLLSVLNPQPPG